LYLDQFAIFSRRFSFSSLRALWLLPILFASLSVFAQPSLPGRGEIPNFRSVPTTEEKKEVFRKSLIVPAALFVAGGIAFTDNSLWSDNAWEDARNESFSDFSTKVDDYLIFAPIAGVYGLELAGVKGKNSLRDRTAILLKAELMGFAVVAPLKAVTNRLRPNGENEESFPSGHTAQGFIAATFLHREYGHLSPWYSIGGYTVAASVGTLRILNNKHYLSDVLFGAGIGILVTNLAYLTHGYKHTKKMQGLTVLPTYSGETLGFAAGLRF
jgi:membrane-associated phospholipid phosphatase